MKSMLAVVFAAFGMIAMPAAVAQSALAPTKQIRLEMPDGASARGASGCCRVAAIVDAGETEVKYTAVCSDTFFEPAAIAAIRRAGFNAGAPQPGGRSWQNSITFVIPGLPVASCPDMGALQASIRSVSASYRPRLVLDLDGVCARVPPAFPASVSGMANLSRNQINDVTSKLQSRIEWTRCVQDRLSSEKARFDQAFSDLTYGELDGNANLKAEFDRHNSVIANRQAWLDFAIDEINEHTIALNNRIDYLDGLPAPEYSSRPSEPRRDRPRYERPDFRTRDPGEAQRDRYFRQLQESYRVCMQYAYTEADMKACRL